MLIKALCDYYDVLAKKGLVLPDGYSKIPIKYKIVLTPEGKLAGIISCQETKIEIQKNGKEKEKQLPQSMIFPKRNGKSAIASETIEHRPRYIFGLNYTKTGLSAIDEKNSAKKSHDNFVKVHEAFIDGLDSPIINALRNFLQSWKPEKETENPYLLALGRDYESAGFAFCLSGSPDCLLQEDPQIKAKWEREYVQRQSQPSEFQAQCAITGEVSDIARIHDKIKGLKGASMEGPLICFKEESGCSYGNMQSYNSNISELAMRKYTEALNYLLGRLTHKIIMDEVTVVFWAMDGGEEHEMTLQELLTGQSDRKTPEEVNAMLKSLLCRTLQGKLTVGELESLDADLNDKLDFYMVGLKPNSSRISMKFLYRKKFGDMLWNVAKFQAELQISENVSVVSLSKIKRECVSPKSSSEKVNPNLFAKLFEAAVYNRDYPYALLETMVRRVKTDTDKDINDTRAGVVKAYLMRNEKEVVQMALDKGNHNQAYLCGRLFAVLENIQTFAVGGGKLNSTIKDKYFASATAKPAGVFPTLMKLSQHHMKKLNDGSQIYYEKLIGQIMDMLENEFPKTLSLAEQGKFIIGYYQQKQDFYAGKKGTEQ